MTVVWLKDKEFLFQVRLAVQLLHDLGTLQYFDNDFLQDYVVINPQWIVDVMACVVSAQDSSIQVIKLVGVQLLHDLGTLQYFDNDFLQDYVVINPQWIVDVMACVVSAQDSSIQVIKLVGVQLLHDLGTLQNFNNDFLQDYVVINPQWIVDVMACVVSAQDSSIQVIKLVAVQMLHDLETLQYYDNDFLQNYFFFFLYILPDPLSSNIRRCTLYTPGCRMKAYK